MDKNVLAPQKSSKYLQVDSVSKFCFQSHISKLRLKLGRQRDSVAKVRHYVSRDALESLIHVEH